MRATRRIWWFVAFCAVVNWPWWPGAVAMPPMTYQGRLLQAGSPANDTFYMEFVLFNAPEFGARLAESGANVEVVDGQFTARISFDQAFFNGQSLWIEVTVVDPGTSTPYTLFPRQEVTFAPYAIYALSGPSAGGLTLPYSGSTASSGTAFEVVNTFGTTAITGRATNTGTGVGQGGYFQCDLDQGRGVTGAASGVDGRGVSGLAVGEYGYGVHGETNHATGYSSAAVIGESTQGRGVVGMTETTNEWVPAIYGRNDGSGDGLYGWSGLRHGTVGVSYSPGADHAGVWAANYGAGPGLLAKGGSGGYAAILEGNVLIRNSSGATLVELGEGLDYAEGFHVSEPKTATPGTVLVIDETAPGRLTVSSTAYDTRVAGIVAGAKGLGSAVRLGVGRFDCDVALAGRVYCNVDATYGAVKAGDLLTTSPTPGHAMVARDRERSPGAILGKAMQSMGKGATGQILVLVTLQ